MHTPRRLLSAALLLAGLAGGATASEDPQVRVWAASCAACHGTDGHSRGGIPGIAGESADRLFRLLKDYKEGTRVATVMNQHAKGYTDDELQRLAQYFASQRP